MSAEQQIDAEDDGLSEYEREFVEAYMGDAHGVGTHAVQHISPDVTARSAASIAYKLLRRPHVRKAIRERAEGDALVASRIERMQLLTRIVRGEEMEKRVTRDGKGRSRTVKQPPSLATRMEACAALAKAAGEHLPEEQTDDAAAKLQALLAKMTVEQLFTALNTPEKGQTQ